MSKIMAFISGPITQIRRSLDKHQEAEIDMSSLQAACVRHQCDLKIWPRSMPALIAAKMHSITVASRSEPLHIAGSPQGRSPRSFLPIAHTRRHSRASLSAHSTSEIDKQAFDQHLRLLGRPFPYLAPRWPCRACRGWRHLLISEISRKSMPC